MNPGCQAICRLPTPYQLVDPQKLGLPSPKPNGTLRIPLLGENNFQNWALDPFQEAKPDPLGWARKG